jgi:nucleoside-diphosphate-sugar epimerase
MKKIMLVGGGGYVGTVLTDFLLAKGYEVYCYDNFIYGHGVVIIPYLLSEKYHFIHGDIRNKERLRSSVQDMDAVVILAGLVGDPITKAYPIESEEINEKGIQNVFETINGCGVERCIFVSTCSNYGLMPVGEVAHENSPLNPLSSYARAKVDAERKLLGSDGKTDYCATILRFATAFGLSPRMRFDLTVSQFTRDLFMGEELIVFDAETWRPYCHILDFSRLIELVLNAPEQDIRFEVFNAGGSENNFTKRGIVELIQSKIDDTRVTYQERGSDRRDYKVNFSKLEEKLNFKPLYTVEQGIDELLVALGQRVFSGIENEDRFGNYKIYTHGSEG